MTIRAKFRCYQVIPGFGEGDAVCYFHAVYGTEGENADYSKATPNGSLVLTVSGGTKAAEFFEQGKDYYLEFNRVPELTETPHG